MFLTSIEIKITFFLFQVKEVSVAARRRDARLSFAFVYPDKNGRFIVRQVKFLLLHILDMIGYNHNYT